MKEQFKPGRKWATIALIFTMLGAVAGIGILIFILTNNGINSLDYLTPIVLIWICYGIASYAIHKSVINYESIEEVE